MKTAYKFVIAGALLIGVNIALSRCKAPQVPKVASTQTAIDTVAPVVMIDTEKTVAPAEKEVAVQAPLTLIITTLT